MSNPEFETALKELIYKIADDELIIGHRNSEWTGLGPMLEEDIAFASIAQDKVGQAYNLYQLLNQLGEKDPDLIAFNRSEKDFKCCYLVEYPIGEYDFSLVRHFLFDYAEMQRFEMLANSSYQPLANFAKKFKGEIKYHIFHAHTWITQLGTASGISHARIQSALNEVYPMALSIFEPSPYEDVLKSENIFGGEELLKKNWLNAISPVIEKAGLVLPTVKDETAQFGGRKGYHTEYLAPMLAEMTEVFREDAGAEW